jgi:plastocyanin
MHLLLIALLTLTDASGSGAKTHTVTIDASRFEPASLTVAPGDTVIWRNIDLFPHTATSRLGLFDSKEIAPGKTWKYVVPSKGRLFEYVCSLHPTMKASLRVR